MHNLRLTLPSRFILSFSFFLSPRTALNFLTLLQRLSARFYVFALLMLALLFCVLNVYARAAEKGAWVRQS